MRAQTSPPTILRHRHRVVQCAADKTGQATNHDEISKYVAPFPDTHALVNAAINREYFAPFSFPSNLRGGKVETQLGRESCEGTEHGQFRMYIDKGLIQDI